MNPLKNKIARLAFQVDRRILSIEEEDHVRLDLLAHEPVFVFATPREAPSFQMLQIDLSWWKEYAFMATLLFSVLFYASNLPAYGKITMANLSAAQDFRIENQAVLEGVYLDKDLWTGEKLGDFIPTLEAKETTTLSPENGILPVIDTPSSIEDRISIPSLSINAPLVEPSLGLEALRAEDWNDLEDQIRSSLLEGVVHYPGTANPGRKGNFFVTGHSSNVFWEESTWNTVFATLPKIEVGAEIVVTQDQHEYTYVVTEKKTVSPKEVDVLMQGDDYQMTLMTCTPVGTTLNRLVVTAELK